MAHSKSASRPLSERIATARREGRTQQALELTKELLKQQRTPEHEALLRDVAFERGCQLQHDGKPRDAIALFQNTASYVAPPEYRLRVAMKLAELGESTTALSMWNQLPDSPDRTRLLTRIVDAAVVARESGRSTLPADLQPQHDTVVTAFAHVEAGRDEDARVAIQSIGLASPFLEWKVALRGLIAFYQNDDARALDNWRKLDPEREPWKLIATFRYQIDPEFRDAQPAAARTRLDANYSRLTMSPVLHALRSLAPFLRGWTDRKQIRNAFREIRKIGPLIKQHDPERYRRLVHILYAQMVIDGDLDLLSQFRGAIETPADDPQLERLEALIGEHIESPQAAIEGWLAYGKRLESLKDAFPGDLNIHARALVWSHLGIVIARFRENTDIPSRIPSAAECYRRSIALLPMRQRGYDLLLDELIRTPKTKKEAVAVARNYTERFPSNVVAWTILADDASARKAHAEAVESYRRAFQSNPMRLDVRDQLANALWTLGAATLTSRKKTRPEPETYRPILQEAVDLSTRSATPRLITWSIHELRLGNDDFARELIERASRRPNQRVAVAVALFAASKPEKTLSDEVRQGWADKWAAELSAPRTPAETIEALTTIAGLEPKIFKTLKAAAMELAHHGADAAMEAYSMMEIVAITRLFLRMKFNPFAKKLTECASRRFPKAAEVSLLRAECKLATLTKGTWRSARFTIPEMLDQARKEASHRPREQQEALVAEAEKLKEEFERKMTTLAPKSELGMNPSLMMRMMQEILEQGFGGEDEDDDWSEDEDDAFF